jgi:iron complex transport system substrate-binding protein
MPTEADQSATVATPEPPSDTPSLPEEAVEETTPEPARSLITVTDQAGRVITIEGSVERLVSGFYISTSTIIALDLADRLVGIEARAADRPIYALARPDLLELPDVGTARDFNLEACLALEPDLVVLPIRLMESAEILTEMGIPVILVSPENEAALLEMITLIGFATGAGTRANELLSYLEDEKSRISEIVAELAEKPTVFISGTGTHLSTAGNEMYQATLIVLAGGINAAAEIDGDSRREISYEQLLAMNPEVFIIPPEADFDVDDILTNPQLAHLEAVITGRVYKMPDAFEAWDSPIPSSFLGIKWLLSILHGEVYPMDEMREAAFNFYREFYGIEIDTSLIGVG